MQCFREGGSVQKEVNFTKRDRKKVEPNDMSQDKKLVKKAFAQHDKAKHGGSEPTEIKLKKGGRAKKECGTVKKFKTGGKVENAYGAKKTDKDIKDIANTKRQKPAMLCGSGKAMKKYADGGGVMDAIGQGATSLKEKVMGTPEQNRLALEREKRIAARKAAEASGNPAAIAAQPSPTAPLPAAPAPAPAAMPAMKKGGKAKGKC